MRSSRKGVVRTQNILFTWKWSWPVIMESESPCSCACLVRRSCSALSSITFSRHRVTTYRLCETKSQYTCVRATDVRTRKASQGPDCP
jgi:hypothetical protein